MSRSAQTVDIVSGQYGSVLMRMSGWMNYVLLEHLGTSQLNLSASEIA
jgi:hypothetical protein